MGEVEEKNVSESQVPEQTKKSVLFAVIMLIIGLFAPILLSVFNSNSTSPDVYLQGMFWMYRQSSSHWYEAGFSITIDPYSWTAMFPFLMLRMVPVSQIYRYYNGKTTRIRVFIASLIGDGYILFSTILIWFLSFSFNSDTFHIPLPFQIIFSIFVLLIFHIPKPKAPWVSEGKSKSWWNKDSDLQEKELAVEDDRLW